MRGRSHVTFSKIPQQQVVELGFKARSSLTPNPLFLQPKQGKPQVKGPRHFLNAARFGHRSRERSGLGTEAAQGMFAKPSLLRRYRINRGIDSQLGLSGLPGEVVIHILV